jgi:O-antigen/teichoic acid export membrane protein
VTAAEQDGRGSTHHASVRVFKNYSFLASSYAVSRLLTFFSLVFIARRLGVEAFGQVNFALAILTYSTLLTHMGLMTFGTREVARNPDQVRRRVSDILSLRMALTLGAFILSLAFAYVVPLDARLKVLIVFFAFSLFPTAALMDWAFKGVERMNVVGIIEILRAVPYLVLVLIWVRTPSDVSRIPIFYFLSALLAALLGLALFWRDYGSLRPRIDLVFWKGALQQSLPLGFAFMLLQVYYLTDTVMLGFLRGDTLVGWYSAAYKSVAFVLVLGGLFFETTFPVISRYYKLASDKLAWLLDASLRITILLAIPMAVGGSILAGPFLNSLYGPQYRVATIAFRLLIWAVAIELVGTNWGYALMACDRGEEYLKAVGLGAVLSIALNLLLIPRMGLTGAGLARLMSSVAISLYSWFQFRRVLPIRWSHYMYKPALASSFMVAVMVLVGHSWVLQMALGVLAYAGIILLIAPAERAQLLLIAKTILAPSRTAALQSVSAPTQTFRPTEEPRPTEIVER